jgi:hypothetical protein
VPVVPAPRVHVAVGLNVPVELVVKLTVPVGVVGDEDVSVTVAVQVVATLIPTGLGLHETAVVVVRWLTVSDIDAVPVPAVLVALTRTVNVPLVV